MFQDSPFSGVCAYAMWEVILMLVGTLLLGLLLGYLIWGWTRRKLHQAEEKLAKTTSKLTGVESKLTQTELELQTSKSEVESVQNQLVAQREIAARLQVEFADEKSTTQSLKENVDGLEEENSRQAAQLKIATSQADSNAPIDYSKYHDTPFTEEDSIDEVEEPNLDLLTAASEIFGKTIEFNDLTVVEGIGPEIEKVLHRSGINSWAHLAGNTRYILRVILDEAGPKFRGYKTKTWPRQAQMALKGEWKKLKAFQDGMK